LGIGTQDDQTGSRRSTTGGPEKRQREDGDREKGSDAAARVGIWVKI
jgi:hypothetical protein